MEDYLLPDQGDNIIRTPNVKYEFSEKCLGMALFEQMQKYSDNIAQIDAITGARNKYGELLEKCIRVSIEISSRGISEDDIICICSPNSLKSCIPYVAGLFLGARVSALDPMMSFEDMKHLLNQVPPRMIFTSEDSRKVLEEIVKIIDLPTTEIISFNSCLFNKFLAPKNKEHVFKPKIVRDVFKTAAIFFSSGTTGLPKGIRLNHYALLQQSTNFKKVGLDLDVTLGFASLYWISTVNILISTTLYGASRLIVPSFNADQTWYLMDKYNVSIAIFSSTQATLLMKSNKLPHLRFEHLKQIAVGAAPVSLELFRSLEKAFPNVTIIQGYGWTEIGGMVTLSNVKSATETLLFKNKPRSCGRPLPGIWCKVVDIQTGKIVGPNQKGELRLKTDYQMSGYYNADSTNAWDSDGWIKTGDICYYDEDRCFYIVDRIKELIKYRGWHVSPAMLEGILLKHPAVKMAVVIGIPHELDNEHPLALVMLKEENKNGICEDSLKKFLDDQVDDNKKLRAGVRFIESIPQTSSGKVKRYQLKMQILAKMM
ncbi:hypothetical protein Trydic_g16117 [Trypoxylus dichotomus]